MMMQQQQPASRRRTTAAATTTLAALLLGVLAGQASAFAPLRPLGGAAPGAGAWSVGRARGGKSRGRRPLRRMSQSNSLPNTRASQHAPPTATAAARSPQQAPHTALAAAVNPDDLVIAPGGANDDVS